MTACTAHTPKLSGGPQGTDALLRVGWMPWLGYGYAFNFAFNALSIIPLLGIAPLIALLVEGQSENEISSNSIPV